MEKRIAATALLLMVTIAIRAQVFKNDDLEISQLKNKAWIIETSDHASMYILEGNEKALLIDTGTKCDSLDNIVRHITQKPLQVVITHAHHDHAGNIGYFDEIYMHPCDSVLMNDSYKGKVNFVEDGYIFDLGGKKIEVRHMPAHTPGSIVLVDKETSSCYTGDAFGSGQVWLQLRPFSPMSTYIASCERMIKIMEEGISELYCGHYFYLKSPLYKDHMIKMRELAISIKDGTVADPQPFNTRVAIGCEHPMIATFGNAAIVYDPEHVNY